MKGYAPFCPIAKATEILAERWTLSMLRGMLQSSRRFSDLRREVPQMSQTLLSKRLQTLEQAGPIPRKPCGNGHWDYHLTRAGEELRLLIDPHAAFQSTAFNESASNDFVPRDRHAKPALPDTADDEDADERGRDLLDADLDRWRCVRSRSRDMGVFFAAGPQAGSPIEMGTMLAFATTPTVPGRGRFTEGAERNLKIQGSGKELVVQAAICSHVDALSWPSKTASRTTATRCAPLGDQRVRRLLAQASIGNLVGASFSS